MISVDKISKAYFLFFSLLLLVGKVISMSEGPTVEIEC